MWVCEWHHTRDVVWCYEHWRVGENTLENPTNGGGVDKSEQYAYRWLNCFEKLSHESVPMMPVADVVPIWTKREWNDSALIWGVQQKLKQLQDMGEFWLDGNKLSSFTVKWNLVRRQKKLTVQDMGLISGVWKMMCSAFYDWKFKMDLNTVICPFLRIAKSAKKDKEGCSDDWSG